MGGDFVTAALEKITTLFWLLGSITLLLSLPVLNLLKYFEVVVEDCWFVADEAVYRYVVLSGSTIFVYLRRYARVAAAFA